MKIDLTEREWRHIKVGLIQSISNADKVSKCKFEDNPLINELSKLHDKIALAMEKEKNKPKSDPLDPYKRSYYASKGFYQQLTAADMMGYKSEGTLVKYRKNGVLKENIHWIRTVGRGISYNPEKCKSAIRKAKYEK
jgi:hypothetical protein|tara:strand:- start:209 stop:619 length:411 start_codon:yes stop_codon:yes gene_type:complete